MDFLTKVTFAVGGYVAAAIFFGLYVGAKTDIKAEIERCNTEKMAAVADAQRIVRYAEIEALNKRIAELEAISLRESNARRIAEEAAREALGRPEKVRTVIKEVSGENSCLDTAVPGPVLDQLR